MQQKTMSECGENELIINIEHFGWCGWDGQGDEGAHYIYFALGRYFSLCDEAKDNLPNGVDMTVLPPFYKRCEKCLAKIKEATEVITA